MKKFVSILSVLVLLLCVCMMPASAATVYPESYPSLGMMPNTPVAAEDGWFTFTNNDAYQFWGLVEADSNNIVVDFNASQFDDSGASNGNYLGVLISTTPDIVNGVMIIMQPYTNTEIFATSAFSIVGNNIAAPIDQLQAQVPEAGISFINRDLSVKYNASAGKLTFAVGSISTEYALDLSSLNLGETCYVGIAASTLDKNGTNKPAIFNARILPVQPAVEEPPVDTPVEPEPPKTGDAFSLIVAMALVSAGAVITLNKKKH